MKTWFQRVFRLAGIVKNVLLSLLLLLLVAEVLALLLFLRPRIPEEGVLLIDANGELVEQIRQPGGAGLLPRLPDPDQTRVRDIVRALRHAADDPRILAVRLDLEDLQHADMSKVVDLHRAIEAFRDSGKPVWAGQYNYTQAQYLIATAADRIWLHDMGNIFLGGIGVYRNYFHDALERLNIDVQVFRVGEYKSALEPLMRNSMSDADRRANQAWMDSLWRSALRLIEDSRHIPAARVQDLLDHPDIHLRSHNGDQARLWLAEKFIDEIGDPQDLAARLARQLARDAPLEEISFTEYLRALGDDPAPLEGNRVAIITASGMIVAGEQPPGTIGGKTLSDLLRKAAADETTKAVVLRIDSPGGSAQASEVIRHAMEFLRKKGKPVVVSMGSVAASGGYWIAAGADEIWAQPTTLTGSIGVFGVVPDFSRALAHVGVYSDGLGTTRSAEGMRVDRPLPREMRAVMQMNVERIYRKFIHIVAEGRKLPLAQVEEIAQGRVWSGRDALRLGLVDYLGDLEQAVQAAARLAGIEENFVGYESTPPGSWQGLLLQRLLGESQEQALVSAMRVWRGGWEPWPQIRAWMSLLRDPLHVYAYSGLRP